MIKIRKGTTLPVVQDKIGNCKFINETNSNNLLYNANSAAYDSGTLKFEFDSSIYGHENVKKLLMQLQFGKCAFCENNVTAVAYGDVEHFRPKKGYKQSASDSLHYTGYYWLAYAWENFVFSCAICNQRYKGNLFPLLNPHLRARNHHDDISCEKPFFIDPTKENPKFLIKFVGSTATGIDKLHRGKKTIEAIGLNRKSQNGISNLFEERNDYFELVNITYQLSQKTAGSQINQNEIDNARQLMANYRSRKKKFSAMINDNFPG
jgi:uncharacterized protein (TIGR02646 family)